MTEERKPYVIPAAVSQLLDQVTAEKGAEAARLTRVERAAALLQEKTQRQAEAKADEEALAILNGGGKLSSIIGHLFRDQGIFLGQYEPKDRKGNGLGKVFNVFAAPGLLEDERFGGDLNLFSHNEAVERIAQLKNWHGFDGENYADDTAFYDALKDGSYKSGWVLPPRELLGGFDVSGNLTQNDNLYKHRKTGAFADIFNEAVTTGGASYWFRSCTQAKGWLKRKLVWSTRFSEGKNRDDHAGPKDERGNSCWPVRLVPVTGV